MEVDIEKSAFVAWFQLNIDTATAFLYALHTLSQSIFILGDSYIEADKRHVYIERRCYVGARPTSSLWKEDWLAVRKEDAIYEF